MRLDTYDGLIENKEKRMGVSHWLFCSLLIKQPILRTGRSFFSSIVLNTL